MAYVKTDWKDKIKDSQGNTVQEGTPVSAGNMNKIEKGIEDAHKQMEQAAKETVSLPYGLSVLNSPDRSTLDVQIEGRTLISMANSDLEGGKKYVLADPKTAVVIDGTTYKGVSKFEGKNARAAIIRTANFEGKIAGSTVENAHIYKSSKMSSLLPPDSVNFTEYSQTPLDKIKTLDGVINLNSASSNGEIRQDLFSFNLIEEVERKIGKIPGSTIADKVAWLKNNSNKFSCSWWGYGSGLSGNKATLVGWASSSSTWVGSMVSHTVGSASKLTSTLTTNNYIDSNGFVHFLAYAEASDGTTASVINTEYVQLDIELKPTANFYAPRVPLYEVPQESYDKILVEWDVAAVANRYPTVEGVQSLQNPVVTVEGDNLIPPFTEWTLHPNARVINTYELEIAATGDNQFSEVDIKVIPGTEYFVNCLATGDATVTVYEKNSDNIALTINSYYNIQNVGKKIKLSNTTNILRMRIANVSSGLFKFSQPFLCLEFDKPFKPRNPSYLYSETILRGLNNVNDLLYEDDGRWKISRKWDELVIDGRFDWSKATPVGDRVGFKEVYAPKVVSNVERTSAKGFSILTDPKGIVLPNYQVDMDVGGGNSYYYSRENDNGFFIRLLDIATGFHEDYLPITEEFKAFFNGWKVKTADVTNKPTAWISVLDGKDAPTQTLDYVKANKAPDYTGYRLLYQQSIPKITDVTDKVEGALSVNGQAQVAVDSGVIVREKANLQWDATYSVWRIAVTNFPASLTKYRINKTIAVYKNTQPIKFTVAKDSFSYGNQRISFSSDDYDANATYYVTYSALDKEKVTVNPVNVKASYNTSIRSTVNQMNEQLANVKTLASIHDRYLYKLLLAAKANGWSV